MPDKSKEELIETFEEVAQEVGAEVEDVRYEEEAVGGEECVVGMIHPEDQDSAELRILAEPRYGEFEDSCRTMMSHYAGEGVES